MPGLYWEDCPYLWGLLKEWGMAQPIPNIERSGAAAIPPTQESVSCFFLPWAHCLLGCLLWSSNFWCSGISVLAVEFLLHFFLWAQEMASLPLQDRQEGAMQSQYSHTWTYWQPFRMIVQVSSHIWVHLNTLGLPFGYLRGSGIEGQDWLGVTDLKAGWGLESEW